MTYGNVEFDRFEEKKKSKQYEYLRFLIIRIPRRLRFINGWRMQGWALTS